MVEEASVYCGSCGGALSASARFCRACGASQERFATQEAEAPPATPPAPEPGPAPPLAAPPPVAAVPQPEPNSQIGQTALPKPPPVAPRFGTATEPRSSALTTAAVLAIAGGVGMCFMVLYAIVYVPLHHHFPFAFGEPLEFGDILAFAVGVLAICIGTLALRRGPASPGRSGALLMVAGLLPIVLIAVWAFPETLHIDYYFGRPFYFGFVYFCELGKAHFGGGYPGSDGYENGYVQVPLLVSAAAVLLAGCVMAFARPRRAPAPSWK
jgi:hypothetical protein